MRRFFFLEKISNDFLVNAGARTISTKTFEISLARMSSQGWFIAMMPPNAERLSALNALLYTFNILAPRATPQGLACLTITQAVELNSFKQERAASASIILL